MMFRGSVRPTDEWRHFDLLIAERVATLSFSRPEKLNALTFEIYADLRELFRELPLRGDVDAVVITGQGRGFCSGGDVDDIIGELLSFSPSQLLNFTRMTGAVVQNMRECPIPIIAAINGIAAGAGAVIALASDFRLMAPAAKFRFLFTSVGLSGGDMGSAYLLPRLVGLGRATEILMFGEPVIADDAVAIGLAHRVIAADELLPEAQTLARRIADGPRLAYSATKMLLSREQDMGLAGAIEFEAVTQALLMKTGDHAEFHAAFTQGRTPQWKGQ